MANLIQYLLQGLDDFQQSIRYPLKWLYLGYMDVFLRYKRSIIGPFWITISISVVIFVLSHLWAQILSIDFNFFVSYFAIGYILWHWLSSTVIESSSSMTEFESIKEMNEELYKNIEMVKKRQVANQYQGLLTSKLIEESKLELPEQLVIAEMDSILRNFMGELNQNNIKIEDYLQMTGLTEEALQEDLKNQATRNLSMVVILDKVVEDKEIQLDEKEIKFIDEHMESHDEEATGIESVSHRLNLESESLRNKAMLHILQEGVSVDENGEKVYLQDVYNQDEEIREEE